VSLLDLILRQPVAYRLWMAPWAARKLHPVLRNNDVQAIKRVLDVGCGPGTNAASFTHSDYVGVDLNPRYIVEARRRYGRNFLAADVRGNDFPVGSGFDCILVNSLLHHLDLESCRSLLRRLAELLTEDGHVHVLELVLPEKAGLARMLARADRGDYPRPLAEWKTIFSESFTPVLVESYKLTGGPLTLWEMVYFKGRLKTKDRLDQ
jgi:SAM-dependent methyltransferase